MSAQERKRVTVLNFYADNLPESHARITRNSLEVSLYNKGNQFQLLERAQVKMIFDELKIRGDECKETSCLVDVGKTLSADFALSGNIAMLSKYRIVIKLISIANAEIAAVYSRDFDGEDEIDSVIDKITDKIIQDIPYYSRHNTTIRPVEPPWWSAYWESLNGGANKVWTAITSFFSLPDYSIYAGADYIIPAGKLDDILVPGYGLTLEGDSENIIIENFVMGLSAGLFRFNGRINSTDKCYLVPLLFTLKYRMNIINYLSVFPVVSTGVSYIYMMHAEGLGFDMEENSNKYGYDPIAGVGFDIEYNFYKHFGLISGVRSGIMYEEEGNLYFVNVRLGTKYKF